MGDASNGMDFSSSFSSIHLLLEVDRDSDKDIDTNFDP
jgi:hypothetical protein